MARPLQPETFVHKSENYEPSSSPPVRSCIPRSRSAICLPTRNGEITPRATPREGNRSRTAAYARPTAALGRVALSPRRPSPPPRGTRIRKASEYKSRFVENKNHFRGGSIGRLRAVDASSGSRGHGVDSLYTPGGARKERDEAYRGFEWTDSTGVGVGGSQSGFYPNPTPLEGNVDAFTRYPSAFFLRPGKAEFLLETCSRLFSPPAVRIPFSDCTGAYD